MTLIECVNQHWSWTGLSAVRVEAQNAFGNLILEDVQGRFWLIRPEELAASVIAKDHDAMQLLWKSVEFTEDWSMQGLADHAIAVLGEPGPAETLYFVIPAVLGGPYKIENIKHIGWEDLMRHAGKLAEQVHALPDGAQVRLVVED